MPEIIMFVGLPASGKSTYAETLRKDGYRIFSSDAWREKNGNKSARTVFSAIIKDIKKNVRKGYNCVLDATNLRADNRIGAIIDLEETGADIRCIVFNTPADICKKRNRVRENDHGVTDEVIDNMLSTYEIPRRCEGFSSIMVRDYRTTKEEG